MNAAGTQWHSTWALSVAASYYRHRHRGRARRQARDQDQLVHDADARPVRSRPRSSRARARPTVSACRSCSSSASRSRTRRRSSRRCSYRPPQPVVGSWYWDGNTELNFRPRQYWPAHTTVSFTGHLDGVAGRARPVRGPHADPVVHHRGLADRGGQHRQPPHGPVQGRHAVQDLADQHRQARRQHAERHLRDDREGQPGADDRPRLPAGGALVGPVHVQRRLPARRVLVGGRAGLHQRQPRLHQHGRRPTPSSTTRWRCPATR